MLEIDLIVIIGYCGVTLQSVSLLLPRICFLFCFSGILVIPEVLDLLHCRSDCPLLPVVTVPFSQHFAYTQIGSLMARVD